MKYYTTVLIVCLLFLYDACAPQTFFRIQTVLKAFAGFLAFSGNVLERVDNFYIFYRTMLMKVWNTYHFS